jgi:hypothetical protein
MATFIFRCPATGLNVQGHVADDKVSKDDNAFESVTCLACRQIHLVNPGTGKVLGIPDR